MQKIFLFVFLTLAGCTKKPVEPAPLWALPFNECDDLSLFCDEELDDLPEFENDSGLLPEREKE